MKQEFCPVCGSSEISTLYSGAADYISGETFDVLQCRNCETAFTFPRPDNMDAYYPKRYRRYNAWVLAVLRTLYKFQVRRWSAMFEKPGSALEVGCGDGLMLDALRSKGWEVAGTERTKEMAEHAMKSFGLKVYIGGFEHVPQEKRFDLIILFQVLEHLHDPVGILKQCADRLVPEGKLIVAVPNFGSWQSRYAGSRWFHLDVPRHLLHFTPAALFEAMHRAGLAVIDINYVSLEHDPYGWVQSALNVLVKNRNRVTRQLMSLDRLTPLGVFMILLSMVLMVPALALSIVSWGFKNGAIMQVFGSRASGEEHINERKERLHV